MRFRRPRSLNGLILVGFALVAMPLLVAVLWALFSLDRLAEQSEQLVITGVSAAENNRLLAERIGSLERVSRQYVVLRNADSLALLRPDFVAIEEALGSMFMLAERAGATALIESIQSKVRHIVTELESNNLSTGGAQVALAEFTVVRQQTAELMALLTAFIENELAALQESTRRAQEVSAWQTAALVPGTLIMVLFFTLLVSRPIRQIDEAINQLGQSGFSKPIVVKGPRDLEKLGRQLDWLRLRLLELAQEKNRFLRHMSHELKTPLANIREGTELLLDGTVGELEPPQAEVTNILKMNGLKLQQLIENLLSFSAWQTKNEVLTVTEFPVRALVISVARSQQLALQAAKVKLRVSVEDIVVTADREKIKTVVDNLLSNAVKFTPKGGAVTIRLKSTHDSFVLELADTGPGIPDHDRARIFEAFFQGGQQHGGHIAGTGIGLSVVLECVQAHEGKVELIDTGEFCGAHFRIIIPQKTAVAETRNVASA